MGTQTKGYLSLKLLWKNLAYSNICSQLDVSKSELVVEHAHKNDYLCYVKISYPLEYKCPCTLSIYCD